MKRILLSMMLTFISANLFGQAGYSFFNFDQAPLNWDFATLAIDTASNPNCSWQIGTPAKTVFTSAYSVPKAMITDTLNPVPANDTSTFYVSQRIIIPVLKKAEMPLFRLHFWFQTDGDSTDFGSVEASSDHGQTWADLLIDQEGCSWLEPKPTLSGSTNGWQRFSLDMSYWTWLPWGGFGDEMVLFKFTYITDSNPSPRDGWMIDDIWIDADFGDGIAEVENPQLISIYPNPVQDRLYIKTNQIKTTQAVQILNYQGQVLYDNRDFHGEFVTTEHLPNGLYFLRYSDSKEFALKKFIINN